jgi:hypothetical protein
MYASLLLLKKVEQGASGGINTILAGEHLAKSLQKLIQH